jgi:maltose alpha-D-glucosyltransferase/alpha-amylase
LQLPVLTSTAKWEQVFRGKTKEILEEHLPHYLKSSRWFGGKAQRMKAVEIIEDIPLPNQKLAAHLTLVRVDYLDRDSETYVLPVAYAAGERADAVMRDYPLAVLARLESKAKGESGILFDAFVDKSFASALLETIAHRHHRRGRLGELVAGSTRFFLRRQEAPLEPSILSAEQSNTSIIYGDQYILKAFRRPDIGINPDLEVGLFLTEKRFAFSPAVAGTIEYRTGIGEPTTLAVLTRFIPNEGDAWRYTTEQLGRYFEHVLARNVRDVQPPPPQSHVLDLLDTEPPDLVLEMIGPYTETARLIGQRSAEMHLALASDPFNPNFAPEPFTKLYQRSLYQSMRNLTVRAFRLLDQFLKILPESVRLEAQRIMMKEKDILGRFQSLVEKKVSAMRIRCHGDYHLGQLLYTGKDFFIIDFEGEPARAISERRIKRSPLRDVAGMLRSFHYAAYSTIFSHEERGLIRSEDMPYVEPWAYFWYMWVSYFFLKSYIQVASQDGFLPRNMDELRSLLDVSLLEKAIYELAYELNNRPAWIRIPIRGIQQLLQV